MNTNIKEEVQANVDKILQLRDEAKLQLHLASREARTEWDEKLAPRISEIEDKARAIAESPRSGLSELVHKLEDFLVRLKPGTSETPPHSVH